eukprot:13030358-Alexandrium_andersonii.AAC.1
MFAVSGGACRSSSSSAARRRPGPRPRRSSSASQRRMRTCQGHVGSDYDWATSSPAVGSSSAA